MQRAGGLLTVSPEPGTNDAAPKTEISILGVPASELSAVRVAGAVSGKHAGTLQPYSQGDGASFVPSKPFAEGEQVTVSLRVSVAGKPARVVGWRFVIDRKAGLGADYEKAKHAKVAKRTHFAKMTNAQRRRRARARKASKALATAAAAAANPKTSLVQVFRSQPNLRPPSIEVTVNSGPPQPGYLFMSPFSIGQAGPMIFDDNGNLVWFRPVNVGPTAATKATNLQVQAYGGEPVLTWWQDPLIAKGVSKREPEDVIVNSAYKQVAIVHAGNGLVPDVHEFVITPQNTALIAVKHDISCNLTAVGGAADASVWDGVIQEIDIPTGLVRWEWNSLDHVSVTDAYDSAKFATTTYPFDFFHLNSIEALGAKDLLISSRNTWTIYNIDRGSGKIHWRLGGKHSNFKMGPGTRTAWQHDASVIEPAPGKGQMLISVFDNGATPKEHPYSRALIERLDLRHHTATLQRSWLNVPPLLAGSQGSVQRLQDGNTVVGWGQKPWATEYASNGTIVFDAHLPSLEQSYRALRFEWHATPATPPKIAVQPEGGGKLVVYASWNGATEVASWQVLEGDSTTTMAPVATAARSGFETAIAAPATGKLIEAQALNAAGAVIGTSAAHEP